MKLRPPSRPAARVSPYLRLRYAASDPGLVINEELVTFMLDHAVESNMTVDEEFPGLSDDHGITFQPQAVVILP